MFVHNDASFVFPKLAQHNLPTGRVYQVQTGEHAEAVFPSITRVLGAKPKPGLEAWKRRVGVKEAAKVSARATVQGANVHKLAECYLGNETLPEYGSHVVELWQHLHPWLSEHITTVYAQESDVYSYRLKVAGRMDLLADVDGELSIVDIKTASKPKLESYIEDYALQCTFYACAVYELTGRKPKQVVLPITNPMGLQVFTFKPSNYVGLLMERINEYYANLDAAA